MYPAFLRTYPPAQPAPGAAFWLPFRNGELLAQAHEHGVTLLHGEAEQLADLQPGQPLYLGLLEGVPCIACEVSDTAALPAGWQALGLRALFGQLEDPAYTLAGYASQMLYWRRSSGYCAMCGSTTEAVNGDWGRRCISCGHTTYPHVSPAIIVLVHDGERVLLTHKLGWGNRYSIIAGFVEPGESLEQCVHREVYEEAGVELADTVYISSQSWPFPHQLMLGFMATYARGELHIDTNELDAADWFHVDALPELPAPLSISRQLINAWIARHRASPSTSIPHR